MGCPQKTTGAPQACSTSACYQWLPNTDFYNRITVTGSLRGLQMYSSQVIK
jgi:hypothetical protein